MMNGNPLFQRILERIAAMLDYLRIKLTSILLAAILCRLMLATPFFPKHASQFWHVLEPPKIALTETPTTMIAPVAPVAPVPSRP